MKLVRVVAAAIVNASGEVLIAKRPDHVHQGGLWEFPGGKIEANETPQQALARELEEEIGITPSVVSPLIRITHHYADKSVHLDVWKVTSYQGQPVGMEGQPVCWLPIDDLAIEHFPAANKAIIDALQLPNAYMISGNWQNLEEFAERLQSAIDQGILMVQLRLKGHAIGIVESVIERALTICRPNRIKVILNAECSLLLSGHVDGLHLTSSQLEQITEPDVEMLRGKIIGVSCHNRDEIDQAMMIGATYISLSPVRPTNTHPGQVPLGWAAFNELAEYARVPAYALGGMQRDDMDKAINLGGQGIAAIGAFWSEYG